MPSHPARLKTNVAVIVDPDPSGRKLLAALVQAALPGALVRVAGNGFQGLVMIAKFAPDIVVTNLHVPHMDGFELVRNVLADGQVRPRMLMAMSGNSAQELAKARQLPPEVVLVQKPLQPDAFIKVLQSSWTLSQDEDDSQRDF